MKPLVDVTIKYAVLTCDNEEKTKLYLQETKQITAEY